MKLDEVEPVKISKEEANHVRIALEHILSGGTLECFDFKMKLVNGVNESPQSIWVTDNDDVLGAEISLNEFIRVTKDISFDDAFFMSARTVLTDINRRER